MLWIIVEIAESLTHFLEEEEEQLLQRKQGSLDVLQRVLAQKKRYLKSTFIILIVYGLKNILAKDYLQ